MKTRLLFVPLLLALVVPLAACGGGSSAVPANAVAVVGTDPITIKDFNAIFEQFQAGAKAQGQTVTPGTPQYKALQDQALAYLVQFAEVKQAAKNMHISVSQAEVTKFLINFAKTNLHTSSMAKLAAALKKQNGLTMETAREEVYDTLLANKIKAKVTANVTVSTAAERFYYEQNQTAYHTAASTTRSVEYILFKCNPSAVPGAPPSPCTTAQSRAAKNKADMVEKKLQHGANFETMAMKYSEDPSTAPQGGKFSLVKGPGISPAFQAAGFALKTGAYTQQPVDATSQANSYFGWFIIKALAPTVHTKAHTQTFKEAQPSIKTALTGQQADKLWSDWLSNLKAQYASKVSYQSSYAPPTTTALTDTNLTTTG